jgi:uncharacterized protein GlcG (DUF336 family)
MIELNLELAEKVAKAALAKAVAAANFGRPTKEMAELHAKSPFFWGTVSSVIPGQILTSNGGVPIRNGERVIGGVGGGIAEQDHECAAAGAEALS